ncbi:hypothetical protein EV715DRAFT_247312 [Schizophyllum commune]
MEESERPRKRFRHETYAQSVQDVHAPRPTASDATFPDALDHWRQLNLAPSFLAFAKRVSPLAASLPLLVHNADDVVNAWLEYVKETDDGGHRVLLALLPPLLTDLRTTVAGKYELLLDATLGLLPLRPSKDTLLNLLAALTSLFRILLTPEGLPATHERVVAAAKAAPPELQRALGEAWASVLRRKDMQAAPALLAATEEEIDLFAAWALVSACKNVAQSLHTASPRLLAAVADVHVAGPGCLRLLRRTFTALAHHVARADAYAAVARVAADTATKAINAFTANDPSIDALTLARALDPAFLVAAVRGGSRVPPSERASLLNTATKLIAHLSTHPTPLLDATIRRLVPALLLSSPSGTLDVAASSLLASTWSLPISLAAQIHAVLHARAPSAQGVWKAALPGVLKRVPQLLGCEDGVRLLGAMARGKAVGTDSEDTKDQEEAEDEEDESAGSSSKVPKLRSAALDVVAARAVATWAEEKVAVLQSEDQEALTRAASTWPDTLAIALLSPDAAPIKALVTSAGKLLRDESTDTKDITRTFMLGAALHAIADRLAREGKADNKKKDAGGKWASEIAPQVWARAALARWTECGAVLSGAARVVEGVTKQGPAKAAKAEVGAKDTTQLTDGVLDALRSPSRSRRLGTLRLLAVLVPLSSPLTDAIQLCLTAERVEPGVAGVRERVLRTGKLGEGVQVNDEVEGNEEKWAPAKLATAWLIGQFAVPLRPLWKPAGNALVTLANKVEGVVGDSVWQAIEAHVNADEVDNTQVSAEAQATTFAMMEVDVPEDHTSALDAENDSEEERTWRDPAAHWLRIAARRAAAHDEQGAPTTEDDDFRRFDPRAHEEQLLGVLARLPGAIPPRGRAIVKAFLSRVGPSAAPPPRPVLLAWLRLIAACPAPRSLPTADVVYAALADALARPDTSLQVAALDALAAFWGVRGIDEGAEDDRSGKKGGKKGKGEQKTGAASGRNRGNDECTAWVASLRALLDDTRARDELAGLSSGADEDEDDPSSGLEVDTNVVARLPPKDTPGRVAFTPLLVRVLFGRLRAKGRRPAALLGALPARGRGLLVGLMVKEVERGWSEGAPTELADSDRAAQDKRAAGFLTLLGDVLTQLGARLVPHWPALLDVVVKLGGDAERRLLGSKPEDEADGVEEEELETKEGDEAEATVEEAIQDSGQAKSKTTTSKSTKHDGKTARAAARNVRALSLRRLAQFFQVAAAFGDDPSTPDTTPALSTAVHAAYPVLLGSRISRLPSEGTQAPGAVIDILGAWAGRKEWVGWLVGRGLQDVLTTEETPLRQLLSLLVAPAVKVSVVLRVFDVIEGLLSLAESDEDEAAEGALVVKRDVLMPYMHLLLESLAGMADTRNEPKQEKNNATSTTKPANDKHAADALLARRIRILAAVSRYCAPGSQADALARLTFPLLRMPTKQVPERVKADLLRVVRDALAAAGGDEGMAVDQDAGESKETGSSTPLLDAAFSALAPLFQSLRSRAARIALVEAFSTLAARDPSLASISQALTQLNAYSKRRVDEPDVDARLTALGALGETGWKTHSVREWTPVLHHLFQAIQDPEELAMRTSTAQVLQRFIDATAAQIVDEEATDAPAFRTTFKKVFYPGIRNGLRTRSDAVRSELLGLLSYAVDRAESVPALVNVVPALGEMTGLRAGGDAEASFFNNLLHVQTHRRARALRRLADYCDGGEDGVCPLRSGTLAEVFVPLVAHFIVPTGQGVDHHVVNDAILCTGRMARHLAWGAYYGLVLTHMRQARATEGKDAADKVYIRALVAVLDAFHFPMDEDVEDVEAVPEGEDEEKADPDVAPETEVARQKRARIADIVNAKLLPALIDHLENRHATTEDGARLPIAPGIAAVAAHLPAEKRDAQISRLLTVLSQVFRSKSQDTRDAARDALIKIVTQLGPPGLPLAVRELREALRRGPQLHTLAYVVHALLVHVCARTEFSNVDAVAADVAHIAAEVIFGTSGKDVESDGFRTKMREVKGSASKGLDAFALLAQHVSPRAVSTVLEPVRSILHETANARSLQQVDDVLRRVAVGLNANKQLTPPELLVLCHTLISQNAKFLKDAPTKKSRKAKGDAIVQVKRQMEKAEDHYASNSFRFVAFGLDLLQTGLRRNRFDLQDKDTVARLDAIIPAVGNTLYSSSANAATGLTKCPLPSLPKSLPVYTRQMLDILKNLGTTESDVAQTALRSLSTIMRDSPGATMQEQDLAFLLELIAPDLEEPERQGAVFAMLRAVVARRFVVPELYDQMQRVSEVMITSQAPQVREACRGVVLQFLLDYPQGKGRLKNTMAFLAKNLSYVHESGRLSVLELLGAVVAKFQLGLVREYAELLFVALVMVIANDESAKCREGAAGLVKALLGRLDDGGRQMMMTHVHAWASQLERPSLVRVAMQVYGLMVEVMHAEARPHLKTMLQDGNQAMEHTANLLQDADEDSTTITAEWQVPYHAMTLFSKLLREFPDLLQDGEGVSWTPIVEHLLFPHSWVRMAACRLLGMLYAAAPPAAPSPLADGQVASDDPLSLKGMQEVARLLCLQLKSGSLDDAHALQIVKNLLYAAKCFNLLLREDGPGSEQGVGEDDGEETDEEAEEAVKLEHAPLPWLFSKLSYQARSSLIAHSSASARMSHPKWYLQLQSILQWFAAMTTHLEPLRLERFLPHILNPLYRITQDEGIRDPQMDELKTLATEVQSLVQSKVAPTAFTAVYSKIRENVRGVQQERKIKRTLLAATNPERAAKRKTKKNESKKESRKRKNAAFADNRGRMKRVRDA